LPPAILEGTMINDQSADKTKLSELNAQFIRNFITNDVVSHNEIIHKDYVYISVDGKIVSRDDYMKAWAHGWDDKVDKAFEYKNEVIRIFKDTGLVRADIVYSRLENGTLVHRHNVYTDVYVKENGRWWCVSAQITDVK
jgi:hypothetical protein